jgi:hypothetical protein
MNYLLALTLLWNGNNPNAKLEQYREDTLNKLDNHLVKHKDCELNNLYEIVERIEIVWFKGDNHTSAYFYEGKIYINKNFWRTRKDAVITILHEVIHAYGICGEDVIKSDYPICHLFGKPVYYSTDITKHIEDHLKEY